MQKLICQDCFSLYDVSVASFKTSIALGILAKILKVKKVRVIKKRWTEFSIYLKKNLCNSRDEKELFRMFMKEMTRVIKMTVRKINLS